jgi:biotin-(acetyl-CoA carboxylase) ligase
MSDLDLKPTTPLFPPLFSGLEVAAGIDPFTKACAEAALGCDAGLVVYAPAAGRMQAAIAFAPEQPLDEAMAVFIACGIGFQNALGALAPPEVGVHLSWQGEIFVNGARCGRLRVASSDTDGTSEPDWIVVGLDVPVLPADPDTPGLTPQDTCLYEEGCADVDMIHLLEAWVRHTLVWISRLESEGPRPLHSEWRGLARDMGEDISLSFDGQTHTGTFMGVDETFGILLRKGNDTQVLPLRMILENRSET